MPIETVPCSPLGFDLLILTGRHRPVRPDGTHVPLRHESRGVQTDGVRVDGRSAENVRTGVHDAQCGCEQCGWQLEAYVADTGALVDGLQRERDRILRTARMCPDSMLSAWYGVFRSGWTFYETHGAMDLRPALFLQCEWLALAYEQATMIVFKRMARIARGMVQS